MLNSSIFVVGSANTDMVIQVAHLPKPGETVIGDKFSKVQGGKGANQAVAARRAGGKVYFVGCVGKDDFGKNTRAALSSEGIDVTYLAQDSQASSGVALIFVDLKGENCIAVASGANRLLRSSDVEAAFNRIDPADIVLVQQEIPAEIVKQAIRQGQQKEAIIILNPAPACPFDLELLPYISYLVPNEIETEMLTGIRVQCEDDARLAATQLLSLGAKNVLITLGAQGVWIANAYEQQLVKGFEVATLDTTAAGDVFCGALAVAITEQRNLLEASTFACAAAALSVTKVGAQPSAPTRVEIDAFLNINR
ncbi:MAG: ribokinase [Bacteroidota bacterium]